MIDFVMWRDITLPRAHGSIFLQGTYYGSSRPIIQHASPCVQCDGRSWRLVTTRRRTGNGSITNVRETVFQGGLSRGYDLPSSLRSSRQSTSHIQKTKRHLSPHASFPHNNNHDNDDDDNDDSGDRRRTNKDVKTRLQQQQQQGEAAAWMHFPLPGVIIGIAILVRYDEASR